MLQRYSSSRKPIAFDFCLRNSIPVLTTSTHVVAWPQGDQFLGGDLWHTGPWPSSPMAFASVLYPGRCLASQPTGSGGGFAVVRHDRRHARSNRTVLLPPSPFAALPPFPVLRVPSSFFPILGSDVVGTNAMDLGSPF